MTKNNEKKKSKDSTKLLQGKTICLLLLMVVTGAFTVEGKQVKALFIGNSYTYVNDLPQLIAGLATSTGDQLVYSSSTPGGYTLKQHSTNATTLGLIAQGGWDYVVLQEQSQMPAFPEMQVVQDVYPYARKLDSLVKLANPCAKTVFYMTWGRKNGDQLNCPYFAPLCTYAGMDSMLQLRYTIMADSNDAVISPVARVWRSLRTTNPSLELYDADESHPSLKGSYAAACAFYTVFYRKDPSLCSYNSSLAGTDATIIKNTAKLIVYDSLDKWYQYDPLPAAQFSYLVSGSTASFQNTSSGAGNSIWYFGDGDSSLLTHPTHTYAANGSYQVMLVASDCGDTDTMVKTVQIGSTAVVTPQSGLHVSIYPNPATTQLVLKAEEEIMDVVILSGTGQMVTRRSDVYDKRADINISHLTPGVYCIQIRTKHHNMQQRFVKQ